VARPGDERSSMEPLATLAISVAGILVTLGGGWATLRAVTANLEKRLGETIIRQDKVEDRVDELRVHVADTCVKKNDLAAVEDRLGRRLDAVEHNIRNMVAELLGAIRIGATPRPPRRPGPT
jgi:hypothetical protein